MNTSSIAHATSTQWLRRGIAVAGALLISGAVVLVLANRAAVNSTPTAPAASVSAAQERFVAFKQAQAEQRDATFVRSPEVASGRERFAALKERQAEQHDTTVVPVHPTGRERFATMKQRQADMRETGVR